MKLKYVLAAALVWGGVLVCAQEAPSWGYIRDFTGTVEIKPAGAAAFSPAQVGQRIYKDTVISTGFKSTALVALGNSTVVVRALTRFTLEQIQSQEKESAELYLQSGRVRVEVRPPVGGRTASFTVRSPIATASVRGTTFEFDGVNLTVDEGRVHVTGGDSSAVYVGAGHRALSNPQTGRTAGAAEMVREELSPPAAAPAAEIMTGPTAGTMTGPTGQNGVVGIDSDVGIGWE
jgi:hypothetical protein